ncbi:MAG TPA: TonB-dependent receptor plug domain-containing protein [Pedobacter sp.]|uniref:TonB-dependent receptor plug domain-containing protein n=1 Tax=Pedobacter sp. TaxID=1411316 RepID=UPI002CE8DD1A|nr:TonB-dependent receptor plug domain-containing protein [Pedobacter sp.]HMI03898.1 TonB-dependent receptor plug domain-containing protein [Pedobacter sp.]
MSIRKICAPILLLLLTAICNPAVSQECGITSVNDAEGQYNIGKFYESIDRLNSCIASKGFSYSEKVQAYRLLSMSYLALDSIEKADESIEKLLLLKDNFDPDSRDPDRFRLQVIYLRQLIRAKLTSSVSKKAETIELAPATIQIITSEDILNRGYTDLEQLFHDLPGFDISKGSGLSYSDMYQRGYRTAANTDRTLLLVDGVEDNEMWSNSAFISRQYALSNIKRVEIIYGPASTIYGANAFLGVINIITKNEEDYFPQKKAWNSNEKKSRIAFTGNGGAGSLNTKFGDVTVSGKGRELFFAITGRVYYSDDTNLSSFSDWDNKWTADEFGANRYQTIFTQDYTAARAALYTSQDPTGKYFTINSDKTKILPTASAITRADSLDQTNYKKGYNGIGTSYSDGVKDYYLSAKLRIGDLKFGFEYQKWSEGVSPIYVDKYYAVSSDLMNWQVRQQYFYARYDKSLSERISFSNFSYFRTSDFGKEAVITRFYGYANAGVSFADLIAGKESYFLPNYYSQQSKQFRTESKLNYVINEKMDFNFGVELRNGLLQGDYVNSTTEDPITTGSSANGIKGGNYYSVVDFGAYGQLSYQDRARKLNLSAAARMDNNKINSIYGYGTVFNPRLSAVYYPGKFIIKSIYSEAFLDASVYNKFATSSARLVNNPLLEPERVKNIEVSARYTPFKGSFIEIACYNSSYSNTLGTVNIDTLGVKTTQFRAIGQSQIQGIQFSGETSLLDRFTFFTNFTVIDPQRTTAGSSIRIGDISSFSANAGINAKFISNKLNVNMRANLVGDKPTGINTSISGNPYNEIPGHTLIHGTIGYTFNKMVTLQCITQNLFDVAYYSPGVRAASGVQSSRIPQSGRTVIARLIANLSN